MAVLRPRKISEFPLATMLADGDFILFDKVINETTTKTMRITAQNFKGTILGPFENDSEAEEGDVNLGDMYFSSDGTVRIRLT